MTALIGLTGGTQVPSAARLRLVFGNDRSIFDYDYGYVSDADSFRTKFPGIRDALQSRGQFINVAWPTIPNGTTTATVDGLNNAARLGAQFVADIEDALRGTQIQLVSVQLLTGDAASSITGAAGALAREAAAVAARLKIEADREANSIASALGVTASAVKWGVAGLALLVALYVLHDMSK